MKRILAAAVLVLTASTAWCANELGGGAGTVYPAALDVDAFVESATTYARQAVPNDTNSAVVAIENELGVNPSGTYSTVVNRLNYGVVTSSGFDYAYIFRAPLTVASSFTVIAASLNSVSMQPAPGTLAQLYKNTGAQNSMGVYLYDGVYGNLAYQSVNSADSIVFQPVNGHVGIGKYYPGGALDVNGGVTGTSLTVTGDTLALGRVMSNNSVTGTTATFSFMGQVSASSLTVTGDALHTGRIMGNSSITGASVTVNGDMIFTQAATVTVTSSLWFYTPSGNADYFFDGVGDTEMLIRTPANKDPFLGFTTLTGGVAGTNTGLRCLHTASDKLEFWQSGSEVANINGGEWTLDGGITIGGDIDSSLGSTIIRDDADVVGYLNVGSSFAVNGDSLMLGRIMSNNSITGSSITANANAVVHGSMSVCGTLALGNNCNLTQANRFSVLSLSGQRIANFQQSGDSQLLQILNSPSLGLFGSHDSIPRLGYVAFGANAIERMRITSNTVGIGFTASNGDMLQVAGGITGSSLTVNGQSYQTGNLNIVQNVSDLGGQGLLIKNVAAGSDAGIKFPTADYTTNAFQLFMSNSNGGFIVGRDALANYAIFKDGGNVGINILTPGDKLQVAGGITGSSLTVNGAAQVGGKLHVSSATAPAVLWVDGTCTGGTDMVRVSCEKWEYPMTTYSTFSTTGLFNLQHSGYPTGEYALMFLRNSGINSTPRYYATASSEACNVMVSSCVIGRYVGNVDHLLELHNADGSVYSEIDAGEASFTTSSSRKLKKDITPVLLDEAAMRVGKLTPVSYRWKTDKGKTAKQYGLIADDTPEPYSDGKSINWQNVNTELLATVIYQGKRIEELEKRLKALEAK